MTASMYTLLILAVIFANLPFFTQRLCAIIPLKNKRIVHHLFEIMVGFFITAALGYLLESRAGNVHQQGWEFYAIAVCLYLVAAFPGFVWRYFWQGRNKE